MGLMASMVPCEGKSSGIGNDQPELPSFPEGRRLLESNRLGMDMYRRLITTCVLASFLAAQWAASPHSHGVSTESSHDDAPHVHVPFSHHGHDHSHAGCHAHPHRSKCDAAEQQGVSNVDRHDGDAVYFAGGSTASVVNAIQKCPDQSPSTQPPAISADVCLLDESSTASIVNVPKAPDNGAPSCARFLSLRSLRI